MRFLALDLRAFGPFADTPVLALDGGNRGLHLIHGPNEAGKSTTLRAIRCLLYGFPAQMGDNHRLSYDKLRVGATLRDESGAEISFLRRKRNVKPLWTLDDASSLPDDLLERSLAGLDEARFNDLFAMDHDELVQGGRAIIAGKGQLAEILFAAGTGLARVDEVRKGLEVEMEALFKKTGTLPLINAGLAALKQAGDDADRAMLATQAWVELDAQLAREVTRRLNLEGQIRQLEQEKRHLERVRDALPLVARRDRAIARLAEVGPVPLLSDGFTDRRFEAISTLNASERSSQDAAEAIEAVDRDLLDLGEADPALLEADAIRRVRDDLGLYRKALEALPGELARLDRIEADARSLLADLRPGASLEPDDSFRVSPSTRERVQALAQDYSRVEDRCDQAERDILDLLASGPIDLGTNQNANLPDLAEALDQAIARVQARGDLEGQLAASLNDLAKLEAQAHLDWKRLPLWSGPLETLETLAIPSKVTLDRFETDLRDASEALKQAQAEQTRLEADRAKLDRQIGQVQVGGAVPSPESLVTFRKNRDETWQSIRGHWLDAIKPVANPSTLARDFEVGIKAADDLADRLRLEADLVAEHAHRQSKRLEILDRIEALTQVLDLARAHRDQLQSAWLETWRAIGIDPLTPREMKDWVVQGHADLARQAKVLRDRQADLAALTLRVVDHKAELARHLERLGETSANLEESLDAILGRAKGVSARVALRGKLEAARAARSRAEEERGAWRSRWALAVASLGLSDDASPAEAHAIMGRLEDLSNKGREIRDLRASIDERTRVQGRFEAEVRTLVDRLAFEPGSNTVEATARDLVERLDRANVAQVRREGLQKRRTDEAARLAASKAAIGRAEGTIGALIQEAQCNSVVGLIDAERASDEVKSLRKDLDSIDEQLSALSGPSALDKLAREASGADPASIETHLKALGERLQPLVVERDHLAEEVGRLRQRLDAMDGGPLAADARQELEGRVAALTQGVEHYARLRLAAAVLREAVERHRSKNEKPVLDRAGALFARLTGGSFAGLRADVDDKGSPVLRGIRGDGTTHVGVEGLSEGTADQLYLALRLASLETYIDQHEPMPLIVDDILVHFDNARAEAALKVLAELSRRTQILFFTHHEHLVDLARNAIGPETLFVHRLGSPASLEPSMPANGHAGTPRVRRQKGSTS